MFNVHASFIRILIRCVRDLLKDCDVYQSEVCENYRITDEEFD